MLIILKKIYFFILFLMLRYVCFFIILECVNDLYASRCTVRYQLSQYCTTLLLVMKKKKKT